MHIDVAFTPVETASAPLGIVVDVLRATSTIAQALAAGYDRVLCCAEIDDARSLRAELPNSLVGGERKAVRIDGFDLGASPRDFQEARAETLILTTTNGTRAILETAKHCDDIVLGSLLNLDAVAAAVGGRDTVVACAGFQGAFALDDAYCAGRIVQLVKGSRTDAAIASELIAHAFRPRSRRSTPAPTDRRASKLTLLSARARTCSTSCPGSSAWSGPRRRSATREGRTHHGRRRSSPGPPDESGRHARQALALAVHADSQRRGAVQLLRQATPQRHRSVRQSCA